MRIDILCTNPLHPVVPSLHRRTPADSQLDPTRALSELFDQIRVAVPERFPAFFEMHGMTFDLFLKKRET
jgi:methionyl-tRNA formyltransferase